MEPQWSSLLSSLNGVQPFLKLFHAIRSTHPHPKVVFCFKPPNPRRKFLQWKGFVDTVLLPGSYFWKCQNRRRLSHSLLFAYLRPVGMFFSTTCNKLKSKDQQLVQTPTWTLLYGKFEDCVEKI